MRWPCATAQAAMRSRCTSGEMKESPVRPRTWLTRS
jgi:hypothetical protein